MAGCARGVYGNNANRRSGVSYHADDEADVLLAAAADNAAQNGVARVEDEERDLNRAQAKSVKRSQSQNTSRRCVRRR